MYQEVEKLVSLRTNRPQQTARTPEGKSCSVLFVCKPPGRDHEVINTRRTGISAGVGYIVTR